MNISFPALWEKVSVLLRIRPVANGLELTDELARISYFDGKLWQFRAVRFEPGVLDQGKIKNKESLIATLASLKSQVPGFEKKSRRMNVVVTLGATSVYNQVFRLPLVKGENLTTAIDLNLRMSVPGDASQTYSGWQEIERDEAAARISILGVFIDKATIDEMTESLFAAGFVAVVFESKALAFARTLCLGGVLASDKSYLAVVIDDVGFDFLVVRNGKLCFEYRNPWRNIADDKGSISVEKFNESFATSLRQVMNFYAGHWQEPLAGIALSAAALGDEAMRIAGEIAPTIPVFLPELNFGQVVPGDWLVALGSGLRGLRVNDKVANEISLLGEGARETFENHQIIHFLSFWSVITPVVFGILAIVFVVADGFIAATQKTVALAYQTAMSSGMNTSQEMRDLQTEAADFNRSVSLIGSIENGRIPRSTIMESIVAAADANNITLSHIAWALPTDPISVAGQADSESQILAFKSVIEKTPSFGTVSLPLAGVQNTGSGYSFAMTFPMKR